MKIILNKKKLLKILNNEKKVGFVPTMGGIHKGHLSLINKSNEQNNITVVSIFVNKAQFNKKKDFDMYPRVFSKDIKILKKSNPHYLYYPNEKEIYPRVLQKKIKISSLNNKLCGKLRPGHFKAVIDVIERFVNIINPRTIYFGEKDLQQLLILKEFLNKKFPKIKVVKCKTIREENGIPYSSRNFLLKKKQKKIASNVCKYLSENKKKILLNKIKIYKIKENILQLGVSKIDYLEVLNYDNLKKYKGIKGKIFIAFYIDNVRLIDNL